jgi:hypothetical protein
MGRYSNGKRQGIGCLNYKSYQFIGRFENGEPSKKGVYEYNDGKVHKGEFKDGKLTGFGVIFDKNSGSCLRGDFENGQLNGYGQDVISEDQYYEGNFENGVKTGMGKCFDKDGFGYQGDYKDGKPQGFGLESSKDNYYYGTFDENGEKNGDAIIINGGENYVGPVVNGKPEGFGKQVSQKKMFVGTLVGGQKSGQGLEQSPQYLFYGNFKDDKYDGLGFYQDKEESWKGEFKDGKKHGVGLYYKAPEKPYFAEFNDGELVPNAKVDSKKVNAMIKDLNPGDFKDESLKKIKVIEDKIEGEKKRVTDIKFGDSTRPEEYEARMDVINKMANEMVKEYNDNIEILNNRKTEFENHCLENKIEYTEYEKRSGVVEATDNAAEDAKVTKGEEEAKNADG